MLLLVQLGLETHLRMLEVLGNFRYSLLKTYVELGSFYASHLCV
jgi:hypothetical protein